MHGMYNTCSICMDVTWHERACVWMVYVAGDSLELRPLGLAAQTDFREHVLAPELDRLTQHPDWDRFKASLNRFYWDPEAEEHVSCHA